MEVSKSRKHKSGVEDGDDQPNKKTKTDEAIYGLYIHIFSMAFGTDKSVLFMEAKCSD